MEVMITFIVVLYLASAVLPIWGLVSLYFAAKRAAVSGPALETIRVGDITDLLKGASRSIADRPKRVLRDLCLIGGGLVLGTTASIISLFV